MLKDRAAKKRALVIPQRKLALPSRRLFLKSAAAAGLCMPAVVGTGEAALYSTYFGAVSAKDPTYGAVGNGSADDTIAVQAALSAAFPGSQGNPFINGGMFFPGGNYKITTPLYLANIIGGRIFGAGNGSSQLLFRPSGTGNNVVANGVTPLFMTNGVAYVTFSDISLNGNASSASSVGVYIYQDGTAGVTSGLNFMNMNIQNFETGILGGYQSSANCEDVQLINVQFNTCALYGLKTVSQNALNYAVYGGGASDCAANTTFDPTIGNGNLGAAYSCAAGSITTIQNVGVTGNTWDFLNAGAESLAIVGGSSESENCMSAISGPIHVSGMSYRYGNSLGCRFLDTTLGGTIVATGCWFNPGNNNGAGIIGSMGSNDNAVMIVDGMQTSSGAAACVFTGGTTSKLYIRGCQFSNASVTASFTGTVISSDAGVSCATLNPSTAIITSGIVTHC